LSGRGLCDELITRPEESYRLWCVVVCDLETSRKCCPYIYDIRSLRVNGRLGGPKVSLDASEKESDLMFLPGTGTRFEKRFHDYPTHRADGI